MEKPKIPKLVRSGIKWGIDPLFVINPIIGCTPSSPGCDHCYAEKSALQVARCLPKNPLRGKLVPPPGQIEVPGLIDTVGERYAKCITLSGKWTGHLEFFPDRLESCRRRKKPAVIFLGSMSDVFGAKVPYEWIVQILDTILQTPQHFYLLLTKHPERMREVVNCWTYENLHSDVGRGVKRGSVLPNLGLGVSVCTRSEVSKLSTLRDTSAAFRFASVEPLLESLGDVRELISCLDWLICGGESGGKDVARPMASEWARSIEKQCRVAGVPFFFKQWSAANTPKNPHAGEQVLASTREVPALLQNWGKK